MSDKAILTELPVAIIENQSLAVDTIAGATVSSNAVISAVRDCAEQAGCDTSALMTAPEKADPTEIDMTADVIIVGGGGAGLSAAVAATDLGASVIIVEKEGYVGGNTLVSGGIFNAPDPEMQKDVEMTARRDRAGGDRPGRDPRERGARRSDRRCAGRLRRLEGRRLCGPVRLGQLVLPANLERRRQGGRP